MGKCIKCGRELAESGTVRWDGNDRVCEGCHSALVAQTERVIAAGRPPRPNASAGGNTMGLVGFILSVVSLVFFFGIASPIALIFSSLGLKREPRGLAIAGTVISCIGTALVIVVAAFFLTALWAFVKVAVNNGIGQRGIPSTATQPVVPKRRKTDRVPARIGLRPRAEIPRGAKREC